MFKILITSVFTVLICSSAGRDREIPFQKTAGLWNISGKQNPDPLDRRIGIDFLPMDKFESENEIKRFIADGKFKAAMAAKGHKIIGAGAVSIGRAGAYFYVTQHKEEGYFIPFDFSAGKLTQLWKFKLSNDENALSFDIIDSQSGKTKKTISYTLEKRSQKKE